MKVYKKPMATLSAFELSVPMTDGDEGPGVNPGETPSVAGGTEPW